MLGRRALFNGSSPFAFHKRGTASGPPTPPALAALALSNANLNEGSAPGTLMGAVLNLTPGSTWALLLDDGARVAKSGNNIVAGATVTDADAQATARSFTIRETLAGASNTPRDTVINYTVVNLNDTNPNAFVLTDTTGAVLGSLQTSNTITIAGLGPSDSATAAVSGDASSQVQKNGGASIAGPVSVVNGDTLAVRHNAAMSNSTVVNTTLTVGTTSDTFSSTTVASGSGLTAPTLTAVNMTADPPQWTTAIPANAGEGDILQLEIDTQTTTGAHSGNYRFEERVLGWNGSNFILLDPVTFVPAAFTIHTGLTPGTPYFLTETIRRNYGDTSIYSPRSNELTFTIAGAGITMGWNPADRSTWSGANQTVTGTNNRTWNVGTNCGGANSAIRGSASFGSGKPYFRLLRTGSAGTNKMGGIATAAYGDGSGSIASVPGALAGLGETAYVKAGADIYIGNTYTATIPGTFADTDPIDVAIDYAAKKVWFGVNGTYDGNPAAGTGGRSFAAFTGGAVKPLSIIAPNTNADTGTCTIETLANATSLAPAGFTPAGS